MKIFFLFWSSDDTMQMKTDQNTVKQIKNIMQHNIIHMSCIQRYRSIE